MKYLKLALIFAILAAITTLVLLGIVNAREWTNDALIEAAKIRYALLGGLSI